MTSAERAFRLLLWAYPAEFRATYAEEMTRILRDRRRQENAHGTRFWTELLWDVCRSAPALRVDAWRAWWYRPIQAEEGKMKPVAILAMLIGALEAVNALVEAWAAGAVNGDGTALFWGTLAVIAGLLLVASGVSMMRRSPRAPVLAVSAAITCLAVFALMTAIHPRLSILATFLGIGFPIGLLFFLYWTRGRAQPTRMLA